MTAWPTVSVVVVSHSRPHDLPKTLKALALQRYTNFEIIVVTDQPVADVEPVRNLREVLHLTEPNISRARNLGLAASRGDIVAFCDDDSAPECSWLVNLVTGFEHPRVASAGGFVRGGNGVSFQSRAVLFDRNGNDRTVALPDTSLRIFAPMAGGTLKTIGTNCAFRRDRLAAIGGFDEAYRYYLDEADVNMRLAKAGWMSAVVPLAEVHHTTAPGLYRNQRRVPKTLYEIGASHAYFLRCHSGLSDITAALQHVSGDHHRRLLKLFMLGLIGKADIEALLLTLEAGFAEGRTRQPEPGKIPAAEPWKAPDEQPPVPMVISATPLNRFRKLRQAARLAGEGREITFLDMDYSPRPLSVRFHKDGFWHHRLGIWGRDERPGPWRPAGIRTRIRRELERIRSKRGPLPE